MHIMMFVFYDLIRKAHESCVLSDFSWKSILCQLRSYQEDFVATNIDIFLGDHDQVSRY